VGNSSEQGGAILVATGTANLTNCTLSGNSADLLGGALYIGSATTLTNCTFSGNSCGAGGGAIFNYSLGSTLTNCIIWNNEANGSAISLDASVLDGLSPATYSHCLLENFTAGDLGGTNNLDGIGFAGNPLFVTPVDPATAPTTAGDLRLSAGSPAIDVGDNTANAEATDLDGIARIIAGTIDLGAYENATPYAQDQNFDVHIPDGGSV
ncbi:MAG: hypothetical protein GY720_18350, partial [bacterium]|nr:hypothetical protein [bacterium]